MWLFYLFVLYVDRLHWYTMLSFVYSKKHAVVYFSIICKLIKNFFFSLWKLLYGKKNVATYSEYLVEVDFLRIYTHINIYCKSISFSFELFEAFRLKLLLAWQYAWVLLLSDTFLFCAWKPRELRNRSVFSFLSLSSSFFSPLLFFLFLCYLCLLTYCIYKVSLFFCHCNLYQQSRCLNNANPFFIQSHVQFSTLATIVCCHRGIHGNLGTKHKPTLFGGDARLEYKEP